MDKDLLEVISVKGKTNAENIFCKIITIMNTSNLNLDKIVGFISNGAATIIGKKWSCRKIKN